MRALAAFIMRGRTQAAVAALIGNWVPLLSPATVALVTLRLGFRQGFLILCWGLLPAVLTLSFSQLNPLMPLVMVSTLLLAAAAGSVLRATASWAMVLMGVVAASMLFALTMMAIVPTAIGGMTEALAEVVSQFQQAQESAEVSAPSQTFVMGLVAYVIALSVILGLLLGRWWQALLYNPGGFAQEFHQLRLSVTQGLVCMGAGVYAFTQGPEYGIWGVLFTLPLLFAGFALIHGLVAQRGWGVQWLVILYVVLIVVNPVSQVLVAVALVDTWLNFRGRLRPKQ